MYHMPHVTCHVSCVACYLSPTKMIKLCHIFSYLDVTIKTWQHFKDCLGKPYKTLSVAVFRTHQITAGKLLADTLAFPGAALQSPSPFMKRDA